MIFIIKLISCVAKFFKRFCKHRCLMELLAGS